MTIGMSAAAARRVAVSLEAVVYPRCVACFEPNPGGSPECTRCGAPTPAPRRLGTIAYHHPNPLRRLAWRLGRLLRRT